MGPGDKADAPGDGHQCPFPPRPLDESSQKYAGGGESWPGGGGASRQDGV